MAINLSNGEHKITTKPPPLPSPLRNSKFSQVSGLAFGSFFYSFYILLALQHFTGLHCDCVRLFIASVVSDNEILD